MGIQEADPNYYFHKFGNTLKEPEDIAVNFSNYDYLQTNKETKLQFELNSLKSEIERLKKLYFLFLIIELLYILSENTSLNGNNLASKLISLSIE